MIFQGAQASNAVKDGTTNWILTSKARSGLTAKRNYSMKIITSLATNGPKSLNISQAEPTTV